MRLINAGSVLFLVLCRQPEFIELGMHVRVEMLCVIAGQAVPADQLDDIGKILESMDRGHAAGKFQFDQLGQDERGYSVFIRLAGFRGIGPTPHQFLIVRVI